MIAGRGAILVSRGAMFVVRCAILAGRGAIAVAIPADDWPVTIQSPDLV
jgi:hypothetical protein